MAKKDQELGVEGSKSELLPYGVCELIFAVALIMMTPLVLALLQKPEGPCFLVLQREFLRRRLRP